MDLSQGWYVRKNGSEDNHGPYSWVELVSFAQTRNVVADDWVWHESRPDWSLAASVAELAQLFPQATVVQPQPQPQPAIAQPQPQPAPEASRKRRGLIVALVGLPVVVLGLGLGGVAWWLLGGGGGAAGGGPDLGEAYVKMPDRASFVATEQWGEVPAGQIGITLAEGGKRKDAEKVARDVGGSVVGVIEYIDTYQIEFPGTTEAQLVAALDKAEADTGVELAFPNQPDQLDEEIWGVRQDPFNDPIYGEGAGEGYNTIGVGKAWAYIKGSGIELNNVKVGVVDDGLYKAGEGRESEFGGDVEFEYPDAEAGERATPQVWEDGVTNPAGSHGTGVATVIAGDPGNGGPAGIAGPLGKKLKVSMINKYTGQYGQNAYTTPDPNDITKVAWSPGVSLSLGSLVAIQKQIKNDAKVINCSFGRTNGSPKIAAAYERFFRKMARDHPDVLFVCSAGNDGVDVDGSTRFPSGHRLGNMITVGAVHNDGRITDFTNRATNNYEVTLAAPGKDAVVGMQAGGGAEKQDGTSFAAPHVTAAAAILKSIDPTLSAAKIKNLLVQSARRELIVPGPGGGKAARIIPATVGGKMLAIDRAVFIHINSMRMQEGLPRLAAEEMENGGVVDAVAVTGAPGEFTVRGILKAAAAGSARLAISVTGANHAVGGKGTHSVSAPGEASWSVTLPEGKGTITVTRSDNGASSVISIDRGALEGTWEFPETMRIAGSDQHFKSGAMVKMNFVREGSGYALTGSWPDAEVTLQGDKVKIVNRYSGLLPGESGGTTVFSGTLEGDTITGTMDDTYNGQMEWIATRVK